MNNIIRTWNIGQRENNINTQRKIESDASRGNQNKYYSHIVMKENVNKKTIELHTVKRYLF